MKALLCSSRSLMLGVLFLFSTHSFAQVIIVRPSCIGSKRYADAQKIQGKGEYCGCIITTKTTLIFSNASDTSLQKCKTFCEEDDQCTSTPISDCLENGYAGCLTRTVEQLRFFSPRQLSERSCDLFCIEKSEIEFPYSDDTPVAL